MLCIFCLKWSCIIAKTELFFSLKVGFSSFPGEGGIVPEREFDRRFSPHVVSLLFYVNSFVFMMHWTENENPRHCNDVMNICYLNLMIEIKLLPRSLSNAFSLLNLVNIFPPCVMIFFIQNFKRSPYQFYIFMMIWFSLFSYLICIFLRNY